jgi:predicted Fe-Mo cluster-binding NifX family protein
MIVAIPSTAPDLNASLYSTFGRAAYLLFVDTDTNQYKAVDNSKAITSRSAGIAAAELVAKQGVDAVLTQKCGPNAFSVLNDANIDVVTGLSGNVRDAIEKYKSGNYKS